MCKTLQQKHLVSSLVAITPLLKDEALSTIVIDQVSSKIRDPPSSNSSSTSGISGMIRHFRRLESNMTVGNTTSFKTTKANIEDPLIGLIICVPHEEDESQDDTRGCSHDVPISMCNSGRHVRERRESFLSEMSNSSQDDPLRLQQSRASCGTRRGGRRESFLSLPGSVLIAGESWKDRFASDSAGSKGKKSDRMIPTPIKPLERRCERKLDEHVVMKQHRRPSVESTPTDLPLLVLA